MSLALRLHKFITNVKMPFNSNSFIAIDAIIIAAVFLIVKPGNLRVVFMGFRLIQLVLESYT